MREGAKMKVLMQGDEGVDSAETDGDDDQTGHEWNLT